MKKRSLRGALMTAVLTALALLAGLTTTASSLLSAKDLRGVLDDRVTKAVLALEKDMEDRRVALASSLRWFERSGRAVQVLTAGDQKGAVELGQLAQASFGTDSFVLTDAKGRVLGWAEDPGRAGDSLAGLPTVAAALAGKASTSLEADSATSLSLRGATPVYDGKNALVGVVSTGILLSSNAYVDRLKSLLGAEVTIFGGDTRLVTTLKDEAGNRLAGTRLGNPLIEKQVLQDGQPYYGTNRIRNVPYSSVYLPLTDDGGKVVGMTFAGLSLALVEANTWTLTLTSVGLSLIILVLTALFLLLYLQRQLIGPLVATAGDLEMMSEGREPRVDAARSGRSDEIGTMSRSLEALAAYLRDGGAVATEISRGNLAVRPRAAGPEDKFGLAFASMATELNVLIRQIRQSSTETSAGIRQISEGTAVLSSGASEGAASLEEMEATLQEIVKASEDNARESRDAAAFSREVDRSSQEGARDMDALLKAMDAIEASAREIQGVVKTIDDIAFQVNLLALNANVEAARAGKYGKGFGVVAEEVRSLARRSAEAVRETSRRVDEVQTRIGAGAQAARGTGSHLAEITSGVGRIAKVLGQVAERSLGQSEALAQLSQGMGQLSQVTQTNAATAEESASVTQQLRSVAGTLEETTRRFTLRDDS